VDSDNDGVNDFIEAFVLGLISDNSNTASADRDNDELPDIFEISTNTNFGDMNDKINLAANGDADNDSITDAVEIFALNNATDLSITRDADADGITDVVEISLGSDHIRSSKPVVWLDVAHLTADSVLITGNTGGHQAPAPELKWDLSAITAKAPDASVITIGDTVEISGLSAGHYTASLIVNRVVDNLTYNSLTNYQFTITNETINDSDYDGVADGYDNYDALAGQEELLSVALGQASSFAIEVETGSQVRLGRVARMAGNAIASVSKQQLVEYLNRQTTISPGDTASVTNIGNASDLYDMEIVNLPETGSTITLVIPLIRPLSSESEILLLDLNAYQWESFELSNGDRTATFTATTAGDCPAPGDNQYINGISEGINCLELTITDGGPNDMDGRTNGAITLFTGIGTANPFAEGTEPTVGRALDNESGNTNPNNNHHRSFTNFLCDFKEINL